MTNGHKYGMVKVAKTPCAFCGRLFISKVIAKQHPDFCAPAGWKAT